MSENNKIAIITGAGSGIGRTVAVELSKDGWSVVLGGRRENTLNETAALCGTGQTLVVPTDVSNPESVSGLFEQTVDAFGRLDLLFNNAGVNIPAGPLEEIDIEDWKKVIDINLTGVFLCTQEAVKQMKTQNPTGGRIINNGSISAQVPRPNAAAYNASKHAVTGLTKSTSLEGRSFNIACGQIDIGNTASPMARLMEGGVLQADGSTKPEPTMDIDSVGKAVVYMANLPLDTNVPFITVMANQMPFIGRG
ncbi:MAG: SDR family oxidoreductase [Cyclobacteriaceae bacterium]